MIPAAGAGTVTVMVPVALAAHVVGAVAVAVGAAGAAGIGPTVTDVAGEVQPDAYLTVTLYVPGAAVKMPVVFV